MTISVDSPSNVKPSHSVSLHPEDIYEARAALRTSANRKTSSSTSVTLHEGILDESLRGEIVFQVTGSDSKHPLHIKVISGTCVLKVNSGSISVEAFEGANVKVVDGKQISTDIFVFDA